MSRKLCNHREIVWRSKDIKGRFFEGYIREEHSAIILISESQYDCYPKWYKKDEIEIICKICHQDEEERTINCHMCDFVIEMQYAKTKGWRYCPRCGGKL